MSAPADAPLTFTEVLDKIEGAGKADQVSLGEILSSFGRRGFGPVLLVPALVAVLPIVGALPGVSLSMAAIELVAAGQLLLGQRGLKLPKAVRNLKMPRKALSFSVRMARPTAKFVGRWVRPRWRGVTNGNTRYVVGSLALALAVLMAIGALIPGAIVPPALAMIVLGLGLTSQDGVLITLALILGIGSAALGAWWLL